MSGFGRRSFLKLMGQFSAILCMSLSQRKTLAQTGGKTSNKRSKRIDVDVHLGSKEYSDYLSTLKKSSKEEPIQEETPNQPIQPQVQQSSPGHGGA